MKYRDFLAKKFYEKALGKAQAKEIMKLKYRQQRHRAYLLITQKVCQFCGTDQNLTVDHIIPVKVTGQDRSKNLANKQLLCFTCNVKKGCKLPGELGPIEIT